MELRLLRMMGSESLFVEHSVLTGPCHSPNTIDEWRIWASWHSLVGKYWLAWWNHSLQGQGGLACRAEALVPEQQFPPLTLCPFHSHKTKPIPFQNGDTLNFAVLCWLRVTACSPAAQRSKATFREESLCQWRNCHNPLLSTRSFSAASNASSQICIVQH